jgi:hypothetical protein
MKTITLNFYHDDETRILACVAEIKDKSTVTIVSSTLKDVSAEDVMHTELVNIKKQVILEFASDADCAIFRQDRTCYTIYQKFAH